MLHFPLSLMNRLNKTESAIFNLIFGLVALEGSTVSRVFVITTASVKCCVAAVKSRPDFAGHVITGNFDIIKDKRIRKIFLKGPKYRIPSDIDFDACRGQIAESIESFCVKWCRRENADSNSLTLWKRNIFKIVDSRIAFYKTNVHLLPPKPRTSLRHLKKGIQEFHSKFVLVPADKASNNIIIV